MFIWYYYDVCFNIVQDKSTRLFLIHTIFTIMKILYHILQLANYYKYYAIYIIKFQKKIHTIYGDWQHIATDD